LVFAEIKAAMAKQKADCREGGKPKVDLRMLENSGFFCLSKSKYSTISPVRLP
jgi:hypothetical protein